MDQKYKDLQQVLLEAKKIVDEIDVPDGGTCNFDSPIINCKDMRYDEDEVVSAAEAVGLRAWKTYGWDGYVTIGSIARGQGFLRTTIAETFAKVLKEHGIFCGVYYQIN